MANNLAVSSSRCHRDPREIRALFLQGPPSPFARELGAELERRGAVCRRINLCFGDWLYWRGGNAGAYRGSLADWDAYLTAFITRHEITDIFYFADRFPYHRVAKEVADRHGVTVFAYEYGYLRPDWVICEPNGQSGYSHLTTDPARILALADELVAPDMTPRFRWNFGDEARGDVLYHLGNYLLWFLYPRFQRDRVFNPIVEYLSYLCGFVRSWAARRRRNAALACVATMQAPFFLVPLQMQNDYQIRENSPFADQRVFLCNVVASFAENAPKDTHLVVKVHPHDNGLVNWEHFLYREAETLGVDARVQYLDGGNLDEMTKRAAGMITINSTSGLTALQMHCPVIVAGHAVYNIPGLTDQRGLDAFFREPQGPDPRLIEAFVKVLAAHCHVRGNFYSADGRRAATEAFADRVLSVPPWPQVFEEGLPRQEAPFTAQSVDQPAEARYS